jgi:hypothetical protein
VQDVQGANTVPRLAPSHSSKNYHGDNARATLDSDVPDIVKKSSVLDVSQFDSGDSSEEVLAFVQFADEISIQGSPHTER